MTLTPCLRAARQAVRHRVDVGVDAGADVLQIDDQHVDVAQHLGGRLARLAVERVDRHAPARRRARGRFRSCSPARPIGTRAAGRRSRRAARACRAARRSAMCPKPWSTDAGLQTMPTRCRRARRRAEPPDPSRTARAIISMPYGQRREGVEDRVGRVGRLTGQCHSPHAAAGLACCARAN